MLKLLLSVTAVTSVLATLAMGSAVAQKIPPIGHHLLERADQNMLSTIKEDGTATYIGGNGRLSGTLNAKGVVDPPSNRTSAFDCVGMRSRARYRVPVSPRVMLAAPDGFDEDCPAKPPRASLTLW